MKLVKGCNFEGRCILLKKVTITAVFQVFGKVYKGNLVKKEKFCTWNRVVILIS